MMASNFSLLAPENSPTLFDPFVCLVFLVGLGFDFALLQNRHSINRAIPPIYFAVAILQMVSFELFVLAGLEPSLKNARIIGVCHRHLVGYFSSDYHPVSSTPASGWSSGGTATTSCL
jgi:hypothetical protein